MIAPKNINHHAQLHQQGIARETTSTIAYMIHVVYHIIIQHINI